MKKNITISIDRQDIVAYLLTQGFIVPSDASMRAGPQEWACEMDFPITVSWIDDSKRIPFRYNAPLSVATMNETKALVRANKRIEAIKLVRNEQGWGLKEAKDWVDYHCPSLS